MLKLSNILDKTGGNETCFTNSTNIFLFLFSANICSKSTIEIEKDLKYVQSLQ